MKGKSPGCHVLVVLVRRCLKLESKPEPGNLPLIAWFLIQTNNAKNQKSKPNIYMNICCIGREFAHPTVKNVEFTSAQSLLDFDAVIIDFEGLVRLQHTGHIYPFMMERRKNELSEIMTLGRVVVVFVEQFQFEILLPVADVNPVQSHGKRMAFKGSNMLNEFWVSIKESMEYRAYWNGGNGETFAFVKDKPEWSVAELVKHGKGHLILLPWLKWDGDTRSASYKQVCNWFIIALTKLIDQLNPQTSDFCLPTWSAHYGWQSEIKLNDDLIKLNQQKDSILQLIAEKNHELAAENKLKILFTAKGDVLAHAVMDIFRQIGANAQPGDPGRDDIIVEFNGKLAVVEVKGKKGSAAEADAAQLEKWVAGTKEQREINPKGILVINAYCETPLLARIEPAFPHQMLKYSFQREHCLITTTQLLGLFLETRANPEKRVSLVDSLFSTVGVFDGFSDISTFLTVING